MHHRFADSTHEQLKVRIGVFLAQASDRDGGRKNRKSCTARVDATAADDSPAELAGTAGVVDN